MKELIAALSIVLVVSVLGCGATRPEPSSGPDEPTVGAPTDPGSEGPVPAEADPSEVPEPETTEEVIETSSPL